MQFIIMDGRLARSRAVHVSGSRLALSLLALSMVLLLAGALVHWAFLQGARAGWPVVGSLAPVAHEQVEQHDRFLRENLDAMARRLGEMQARVLQLETLGERVSGLAGVSPRELKTSPGRGGALVEGRPLTLQELQATLGELERQTRERTDWLTVMESRLVDQRVRKMMSPSQAPVAGAAVGSPFGRRIDPFTGRSALHTGLDFQAGAGTPILAAAGGVVVTSGMHPEYGNMVEIDHGNNLVTRYGHASRLLVRKGDLVRRGQRVALVGSTGRSTGAHLHFEVLVQGQQQDPKNFLASGRQATPLAQATPAAARRH